jgi:hypothetical protein
VRKANYEDLIKFSGRPYQPVVRAAKALLGPAPHGTLEVREFEADDAFGVHLAGLLVDGGIPRHEAAEYAWRMIDELDMAGLLPSQIWGSRVEVPRILARIHYRQKTYELRIYDSWPKTDSAGERVDEGPYAARWFPEHALGTTPGRIFELEVTGQLLAFKAFLEGDQGRGSKKAEGQAFPAPDPQ